VAQRLLESVAQPRACAMAVRAAVPHAAEATYSAPGARAWVLLPDHFHCIWTLPAGDADYSTRWNIIKAGFSSCMKDTLQQPERLSASRTRRRALGIWQRRFWEHVIRDEDDRRRHLDYIHYNPVKHGLAERAADWPCSSFHRLVASGRYPRDWGTAEAFDPAAFGDVS